MIDKWLTFIETPIFTEDRKKLLPDDEYQRLQAYMLENHHFGDYIPNTGGCQKIRWKLESNHKGKSGGIRVIYYTYTSKGKLFLMLVYSKSKKDNMSDTEKSLLKNIVTQITGE
ncbi:MAG: type II toxin-antitoxin system RelE/ParE family toxin [[Actinobacillus] rossii]|uniref:Toxin HigB-2 n=1 Tax=[Actinobacillus] rossii TaxID=123820 RepID=A0A380TSF3_9PAST|nr:type II toxin-antitoxin system RelE/ParE family toxin [[Actinobacillus] rossii]MDY3124290.1 type II toxin-antitoxin system RelE/ParE family toxin [[Actinobacillus] rossii]SUT91266.1 toxin HigB-2 [[Actinobacillus] rossii]